MFAKPQPQHQWLEKLVGTWAVESECIMGPDQPPSVSQGEVTARSLGGLWIILEGFQDAPDGDTFSSIMSLGFDPSRERYIGTFLASMMTHLWHYFGTLDPSGRKLVLDTEGPKFDGSGLGKYQDIVELVDDEHWILSSQIQGDDGAWIPFMTAHHRRK